MLADMMRRWLTILALVAVGFVSPAVGASNKTPKGSASVSCGCTCGETSNDSVFKSWSWSGSRADCQNYAGSNCSFVAGGVTHFHQLHSCDTFVSKPTVKRGIKAPPSGVVAPQWIRFSTRFSASSTARFRFRDSPWLEIDNKRCTAFPELRNGLLVNGMW